MDTKVADKGNDYVMSADGDVCYGAARRFFMKTFAKGATVAATNAVFGDPIVGTVKALFVLGAAALPAVAPASQAGCSSLPLWRRGMVKGQYKNIASINQRYSDSNNPTGSGPTLRSGLYFSALTAYTGAAVNSATSTVYIAYPGGHHDGSTNVMLAIDFTADAPQYAALSQPSLDSDRNYDSLGFYRDGKPAASHTYYVTKYFDDVKKIINLSVPDAFGHGGQGRPNPVSFDLTTKKADPLGTYPANTAGTNLVDALVAGPDASGNYFIQSNNKLLRFNGTAKTWTNFSDDNSFGSSGAGGALDTRRNRILCLATPGGTGIPGPFVRDTASQVATRFVITGINEASPPWGGTGQAVIFRQHPTDAAQDVFLVTNRGLNGTVYAINAGTGAAAIQYKNPGPAAIEDGGAAYYTRGLIPLPALGGYAFLVYGNFLGAWFLKTDDVASELSPSELNGSTPPVNASKQFVALSKAADGTVTGSPITDAKGVVWANRGRSPDIHWEAPYTS